MYGTRSWPCSVIRLRLLVAALSLIAAVSVGGATLASAFTTLGCKWTNNPGKDSISVGYSGSSASYSSAVSSAWSQWNVAQTKVTLPSSTSPKIWTFEFSYGNTGQDGFTSFSCSGGIFVVGSVYSTFNHTYTSGYNVTGKAQHMVRARACTRP